ncbi:MAG: CoA transferase [Chloroflexota bacterium]|nr:MAG: CoA transferase [Chloroflexota bacterium]
MSEAQRPLQGIRVIDFGQTMAGPLLSCMLADMGAEVIKVETRKRPDSLRLSPDNLERDVERDPWFHSANRNKLGITVDFSHAEGVELLKRLVAVSDIVVENFSPDVMAKRGLDYATLRLVNPALVMISLPAAGQTGPLADLVTYGPSLTCFSGVDSMVGYPGERVLGLQQAYADANGAIMGAIAVMAALRHRQKTGVGQYIEMAQFEATVATLGEALLGYFMNGVVAETMGNRHASMAPHGNYRCEGEDSWVSIAVSGDHEWRQFCKAIGNPAWTEEPIFADSYQRLQHRNGLDQRVTEWTQQHSSYEVMQLLQEVGVAAMPCVSTEERFLDPHITERRVYLDYEHPVTGVDWISNLPFRFSSSPCDIRRPSPQMGEHNEYVCVDLLGMTREDVAQLTERGVLN